MGGYYGGFRGYHLGKRSADAEADAEPGYFGYGGYGGYGGLRVGHYGGFGGYYRGKRSADAEADAEPGYLGYGGYGGYGGFSRGYYVDSEDTTSARGLLMPRLTLNPATLVTEAMAVMAASAGATMVASEDSTADRFMTLFEQRPSKI